MQNKQEEYRKKGKQLTYEEAYDEVIASSMESVLNDGRVMDLLDEVETKDKDLFEQIRSFLEEVAQLIHETIQAYKGKNPKSPEGRIVKRMTGIYEQLQQVFAEGLHEAGENYREGGKENTALQGGVKTQSRQGASAVYEKPAYERWEVETALADALEKKGNRHENVIKVGSLPKYIVNLIGIEGDMYIHRDHAYENMVSEEQAKRDGRYKAGGHYHNHGEIKMADAIMALEHPILTISGKGNKYGNPVLVMLLDVEGSNGAPLYATLGFYSGEGINGRFDTRPHLVLTIAERDMQKATPDEGRDSYEEVIRKAVEEGRVIDLDNEKRAALSVIAKQSRLGNVSAATLNKNLSQFKKEIKTFREEKKINYSVRYQVNQQAQQHLQEQNAGMGEDVAALNALVAAQRKRGSEMTGTALYAAASHLMKTAGAKGDKYELMKLLDSYYRYVDNGTAMTWDGLRNQGQKVVDWLMEHTVRSKQLSDYARDILNELRTSRIYLDDTQRGEAAHLYGSFGAYRNMLMGSIVIANDNAVSLDTKWQELAQL